MGADAARIVTRSRPGVHPISPQLGLSGIPATSGWNYSEIIDHFLLDKFFVGALKDTRFDGQPRRNPKPRRRNRLC